MPHFANNLHSKLPNIGTNIFTTMSGLAQQTGAINLSQGFPDFPSSPELIELVNKAMVKGHNQYAPMPGIMPLREQIALKMEKLYSTQYNPKSEITITPGATYAIYTAISTVINEGDEVIIFTPAYDCYAPAVELNGGKPVFVQLKTPDYSIDWNEVQKVITRKTRMIIINTPHNPTGSMLTAEDMIKLGKITKESDIIILSDEVYEHILFDGYEHQSVGRFPELVDRSFVVFSFGKTYHNTGWKMGYCLAPENLMKEYRKQHQFIGFSTNTPFQYALAAYMKNDAHYMEVAATYETKRNLFNSLVKDSRFVIRPSSGTYFQLLDYGEISDEADTDFAIRLTKEKGIASIPISVFYNKKVDNKVLRFCFAKTEETLKQAADILCKI